MMKTKHWTGGVEEEYETQHFGFGAQKFQTAMRQMVEEKIKSRVKDMELYLQESLDLNEKDKVTLTHSCDKLIRLYCERAGPSLEVIDGEIERLLKIPDNVLLPEDEVQVNQVSGEEYEKLKEEVAALRKRVERGALMGSLLASEEEELSNTISKCEFALQDMEILEMLQKEFESKETTETIQKEINLLCSLVPTHENKLDEDI